MRNIWRKDLTFYRNKAKEIKKRRDIYLASMDAEDRALNSYSEGNGVQEWLEKH